MPFEIVRNDLRKMQVDAIVNPTNNQLSGRAGVDGAIQHIEGLSLQETKARIGQLAPGACALTKAFKLPASYIIHTLGPVWGDGSSGQEALLKTCYKNVLDLALEEGFESLAFPLISSGSYGCPKDMALKIAVAAIGEFLLFNEMTIYLVVYDKKSYQLSEDLYTSVEAYIDDHYMEEYPLSHRQRVYESAEFIEPYMEISESISSDKLKRTNRKNQSLEDVMNQLEETFAEMLLRLIDDRCLKDPDVYKKANVTKQTFSKIRNNSNYTPTKQTVLAFAIALELSLDETKDLLLRSGYALSKSSRFDVIIGYFFEAENYDIYEINEVLFAYDEKLLGV